MIGEYLIPECNLTTLESCIQKINKAADKLGLAPTIIVDSHIDYREFRYRNRGQVLTGWKRESDFNDELHEALGPVRNWYSVTIQGDTPKFNGWTFCATLSPVPTDDGVENQIRKVPGEETIPVEYRKLVGQCDHCNQNRRRNETFVVRHESGDYKMVGSTCIKDFLGHSDPHSIAQYLELIWSIASYEASPDYEDWGMGGREGSYFSMSILAATIAVIKAKGWKSKGDAYNNGGTSTASNVMLMFTQPNMLSEYERKLVKEFKITDECHNKAQEVFEWLKTIDSETDNDYMYNLSLLGRCSSITYKSVGILCSSVVAYDKAMARKQGDKLYANSKHIGEVKQRLQLELTVNRIFEKETDFGLTRIHHMSDPDGNYYVWFASSNGLELGQTYNAMATIKAHSEFNGIKQTIVNRVSPIKEKVKK